MEPTIVNTMEMAKTRGVSIRKPDMAEKFCKRPSTFDVSLSGKILHMVTWDGEGGHRELKSGFCLLKWLWL